MIKLFVFDTNSLISAAILPNSVSGGAFFRAIQDDLILIAEEIMEEPESVLGREKFDKYFPNPSDRSVFLNSLFEASLRVEPNISITACRDPKDDKFLELVAVAANASCIITGDDDLLVLHPLSKIPILNASDFLVQF